MEQRFSRPLTIGIVAAGASADELGAHLMRALLAKRRDLRFSGVGGARMAAAGAEILFAMETLEVGGYIEGLTRHREIARIRERLKARFLRERPALFIGVGAPEFNLDLEIALKQDGIRTVHYAGASAAGRREDAGKMREAVTLLLTVFPSDADVYQRAGVAVECVGHPLADLLAELPTVEAVRDELRVPHNVPVVALLPGSRAAELPRMAEVFIRTAAELKSALPDVRFLAPFATRESKLTFEAALARVRPEGLELTMIIGHSLEAMAAADVVLVASGTASLEAALLKRPMVITGRTKRLSRWMPKPRAREAHVGMPNILAGERIVPELLEDDATPEKLAQALLALMRDAAGREKLDSSFEAIRSALRRDTAERAPAAILPLIARA